ncbi:MAG: peptide chain release factor 1 [Anaerolineales bacterium]|nr:MAG: peptide chain release factor 1 [Anaerolineales bacterium]
MVERLEFIKSRYTDLSQLMSDPNIAADYEKVAEYAKERAELQESVDLYQIYQTKSKDLATAQEMLSDDDLDIREMAREEISPLESEIDALLQKMGKLLVPKDPRDERNVIIEIRAGAGGDEAGLFAAELLRMYTRYAERQPKWKTELISENATGIGGYKEVVFTIQGKGAYSRLKFESGVHRVQRVPVTESSGRIHTSTVTVAVLPEVDEVEIKINTKDLEMTNYGSSGPGGQHMQKNDTAIRITHIPTGTVVTCESERSLTQNRNSAMSVLRARLYEAELHKQTSEIEADRRAQVGSGERSEKIRTYNYPQNRITDHRIGMNSYNLPVVMEGNIDDFIEALAMDEEMRRLEALN